LRIISADHVASYFSMHGLKQLSLVSNLVLDFLNRMLTNLNELLQRDAEFDLSKVTLSDLTLTCFCGIVYCFS
jgi:hypothetical protein